MCEAIDGYCLEYTDSSKRMIDEDLITLMQPFLCIVAGSSELISVAMPRSTVLRIH